MAQSDVAITASAVTAMEQMCDKAGSAWCEAAPVASKASVIGT